VRRTSWPLAGAVAGLAVALVVTLLQDSTYRADASLVLVRQGQPPGSDPELEEAAAAAAELFESRAVAVSALANLGLEASPDEFADRVDAEAEAGSSLVRIAVDASGEAEARRAAQEVAEVATVLFNDRFGPQTVASVWETAEADPDRVSPKPARNLALGALLGALAGWVALLLARRRPRASRRPAAPPKPAAAEPEPAPAPPPIRDEDVALPSHKRSGTVPGTGPGTVPPPAPPQPFALPRLGEWTIGDVERLIAEHGASFPEQREELESYVDALRAVAGPDGSLPGDVDLVIEDVFADLIARSGSSRTT
jgi:capsular polysaccharide biosynthesis protein